MTMSQLHFEKKSSASLDQQKRVHGLTRCLLHVPAQRVCVWLLTTRTPNCNKCCLVSSKYKQQGRPRYYADVHVEARAVVQREQGCRPLDSLRHCRAACHCHTRQDRTRGSTAQPADAPDVFITNRTRGWSASPAQCSSSAARGRKAHARMLCLHPEWM